jgi:cellulose synthase/poly-beta-1,6-N-acetylglucosamine synthase-like glycosyltransferase
MFCIYIGSMNRMHERETLPLISAIIPTRNRLAMLIRTARSVAGQTYPNIEIIIVDDGPECGIEKHTRKEIQFEACRVVKNTRTPGAAGARNTGFFESKGEFTAFLDDEWMPEKIEKQVEAFQKSNDNVGIVCTHNIVIHNSTKIIRPRQLEGNVYETLRREHTVGNTLVPLIKRHVLEEVGLFDEDMPAAQDTELWLRIAKRYHFTTMDEPLVRIHWHDSERITENPPKQILGTCMLLHKHCSDLHIRRQYNLIKKIIRLTFFTMREQFRCELRKILP